MAGDRPVPGRSRRSRTDQDDQRRRIGSGGEKCAVPAPDDEHCPGGVKCPRCLRWLCYVHYNRKHRMPRRPFDVLPRERLAELGVADNMCGACLSALITELEYTDVASNYDINNGKTGDSAIAGMRSRWDTLGLRSLIRVVREHWVTDWKLVDPLLRMVGAGIARQYYGRDGEEMPQTAREVVAMIEDAVWAKPRHHVGRFNAIRSQALGIVESHRVTLYRTASAQTASISAVISDDLYVALSAYLVRRGSPYGLAEMADRLFSWATTAHPLSDNPFVNWDAANMAAGHLFRSVFGNPYHTIKWGNDYRTSTVLALAEGIHLDRAFDRLPILADALQDAGYADGYLLEYLRNADLPHCRGDWAVELCRHGYVTAEGRFTVGGYFSPLVKVVVA